MVTDPYRILGVSRDATDEEIKKAYRTLSRKYHPDANVNNPDKARTDEKFKELQQAYDQIQKEKQYGSQGGPGGYQQQGGAGYGGSQGGGFGDFGGFGGFGDFGGFGGFGGQQGGAGYGRQQGGYQQDANDPYASRLNAAHNYIQNGHYAEALNVLEGIDNRSARWYYLSALANYHSGNNVTAKEHAERAAVMEPDNMVYRQLVSQMESGGTWYNNMGSPFGGRAAGNMSGLCYCCALNMICNCCCRGGMYI